MPAPSVASPHLGAPPFHWSERRWARAVRGRRGRPLGLATLAVLLVLLWSGESRPVRPLRLAGFDLYQTLWPRIPVSAPAVIVEIDDESLARHGQWPWPRTLLAQLVSRIAAAHPAAIGIDIFMPERDRLSPAELPALLPDLGRTVTELLSHLPSNDTILAKTLQGRPVVLAVAGLASATDAAGIATAHLAPMRVVGPDPVPFVRRWASLLRSVNEIDSAAAGHGLVNVDLEAGVVRRLPVIAAVGSRLVPGFGPEVLRVASGAPAFGVRVDGGVDAVAIGGLSIPTRRDGSVWIHFGRSDPARFVSADRVLAGTVDPARFARKLVLIGVTALGLSDYRATPVADRMAGVEIHAQLLEGIFDRDLLSRPRYALWAELCALAAGGILLVLLVPRLRVWKSTVLLLVLDAAMVGAGVLFYLRLRILFDAAAPTVALGVLFATMLGVTLAESDSQRRVLRRELARQREAALKLAGELEAARRIQMGILPNPAVVFASERRVHFYAFLEPAREVGGDLYDFFLLDDERVFVLIGDVSGKGLPGSLFMAVSKTLCKSSALRHAGDVALMMREANAEIARDNGEGLFVTAWVGVVNTRTGELSYCNAGHEPPYILSRAGGAAKRLVDGGGPPFCVVENFPYEVSSYRLAPGEGLCLITDGVTEAQNAAGEFYGRKRLENLLARLAPDADADHVGEAIRRDVDQFEAGVEPSDDVAIVAFRWTGVSGR
jgi:adenylate cyclase